MEAPRPTLLEKLVSPLRLVSGFSLVAAASTVTGAIAVALLPSRPARIKLCNYYGKVVGRSLITLAGVTPVVRNKERIDQAMPAIYVSNHTSVLDMFFAIWLCPIGGCGIAKKEIASIPFFGWLYMLSGHLLIDRSDRAGAIAALAETADLVRKHKLSIWMWPEGTRSNDGHLLPLKKGLAHLALATGLPIVPIVLHNAHHNWPKHTFTFHPMTVEVDVLEPIDTSHWKLETIDEHLREVHTAFANALGEGQKPLREQPVPPREELAEGAALATPATA